MLKGADQFGDNLDRGIWEVVTRFNAAVTAVYDSHHDQPVSDVLEALMTAVRANGADPTEEELLPYAEAIFNGVCPGTDLPPQKLGDGINNDGDAIGPDKATDR